MSNIEHPARFRSFLELTEGMAGTEPGIGSSVTSDFELDIETLAQAEPEFRVVTARGERKGVRLEPIFWHALDIVAADIGMPRNALALAVMGHADKTHANATSLLRSFLITYLLKSRSTAQSQSELSGGQTTS